MDSVPVHAAGGSSSSVPTSLYIWHGYTPLMDDGGAYDMDGEKTAMESQELDSLSEEDEHAGGVALDPSALEDPPGTAHSGLSSVGTDPVSTISGMVSYPESPAGAGAGAWAGPGDDGHHAAFLASLPSFQDALEALPEPVPAPPPPALSHADLFATQIQQHWALQQHHGLFDYFVDEEYIGPVPRPYDFSSFMEKWIFAGCLAPNVDTLKVDLSSFRRITERPDVIERHDLRGDDGDIQGIAWAHLGTTRERAREVRERFSPHTIQADAGKPLANSENFYRFRRMNTRHRPSPAHFQLRNLVATPTQCDVYYASHYKVMHASLSSPHADVVMTTPKVSDEQRGFTTLTATPELLIAGTFTGEYSLLPLQATHDTRAHTAAVTSEYNGITNHIHTFASRSTSAPTAVFCSNDRRLRLLDTATLRFTHATTYAHAINAAATSPCARLRAVVGDFDDTLITDAASGETLACLPGHVDHAFAVAWAPDGVTLATGAQDGLVIVRDARNWARPVTTITTRTSCPRSLAFSPAGAGQRLLYVAEEDDGVQVVDAVAWSGCQRLEMFGTLGGLGVSPDGGRLTVAVCDPVVGGLVEFERCGGGKWGVQRGVGGSRWLREWQADWWGWKEVGERRMGVLGSWGGDGRGRGRGRGSLGSGLGEFIF